MNDYDSNNVILLNDEDGKEVPFEFLDLVELDGEEYVVLLPIEDDEQYEVVILRVVDDDGDCETYLSVDDDAELMRVFGIFKEHYKDDFEWVD